MPRLLGSGLGLLALCGAAGAGEPPALVLSWGSSGAGPGQFDPPHGIAVGTDGVVFVTDHRNHRVQRFDASGNFLGEWGTSGSGPGQFQYPWGIAVAADGEVFVADGTNRVHRFAGDGTHLTDFWMGDVWPAGRCLAPLDVAIGPHGRIYVAQRSDQVGVFEYPTPVVSRSWADTKSRYRSP